MNKVYSLNNQSMLLDQASNWLVRIDRGLSTAEHAAMKAWLADDERHLKALLDVAQVWDQMDALGRLSDLFPLAENTASRPSRTWRYVGAIAAALVVAVMGVWMTIQLTGGVSLPEDNRAAMANVFETGTGEQSTITLPDGSKLTLNTDSAVSFSLSSEFRRINLLRGEVHIDVAHDKSRPFRAYAGDNVVEAVGTAFNLELTDDQQVELIVTEGRVLVNTTAAQLLHAPDSEPAETSSSSDPMTLSAGETVVLGNDQSTVDLLQPEEVNVKLSWKQGNLVFKGESLEQAIAEIERYTTVEFIILDDDLKLVRVAGLFKAGDVDGLINTLHSNFDVNARRIGDNKVELSRR